MKTDNALALLGSALPIVQAPMAGVSSPEMAASASNAGALGSLGLGASTPSEAQAKIVATRSLTSQPFNVNFFCHRPARPNPTLESEWIEVLRPLFKEFGATPPNGLKEIYKSFIADSDMIDMLLTERPAIVSFHFGLPPRAWINALRDAGIVVLACATSVAEAGQIEAMGIDMIVAQGFEAGGHRGVFDPAAADSQLGTFALVRAITRSSRLPVIAAGGIMDGRGIAEALGVGAAAVQMGTAFLLCPESLANAGYRSALKSGAQTSMTATISGRPARGVRNRLYLDSQPPAAIPDYPIAYDAAKALMTASNAKGSSDFGAHWAGQGVASIRELPIGQLIAILADEWRDADR